jgi:hypothetical protein
MSRDSRNSMVEVASRNLAVKHQGPRRQLGDRRRDAGEASRVIVAIAADEAHAPAVFVREHPPAVALLLVDPAVAVERLANLGRRHGRVVRQHGVSFYRAAPGGGSVQRRCLDEVFLGVLRRDPSLEHHTTGTSPSGGSRSAPVASRRQLFRRAIGGPGRTLQAPRPGSCVPNLAPQCEHPPELDPTSDHASALQRVRSIMRSTRLMRSQGARGGRRARSLPLRPARVHGVGQAPVVHLVST